MNILTSAVITVVVICVIGCSSPFDDRTVEGWTNGDPDSWRLSKASATHSRGTLATQLSDSGEQLIEPDAGPSDYIQLVLQRNPQVRAAELKVQRLTHRIPQATSLDDPMFTVSPVGEMAETAAGQVSLMTGVSQKLPFSGKLETRGRIASQQVAVAVQDLQRVRLNVIADTRRAYWSYYETARAIDVIAAQRTLLAEFKQIAEAKYRSGTATQQDVLRASVELSNLDNELITVEQRQTTAVAMLNDLLDRRIDAPLPEPGPVELDRTTLELNRLMSDAAMANPDIQRVHERIEAYRQRLELARLQRWPDLTVSVSYNVVDDDGLSSVANGDDQWWMGFGVNLPVWTEKLDAAEQEALKGVLEGVADLTGERNRVAFRVQDALVKVDTQQRLVLLFQDVIIPQARQTVEASASSYRAGRTDFLTLVDNWGQLLDFELMYHRNLAQFEQSYADLQQVVGQDIPRQPDGDTRGAAHASHSGDDTSTQPAEQP